ncbi:MAG: hypothetical protein ACFFDP_11820 [Promethearchaeota archaeon]
MSEKQSNFTRRNFMTVGSAAIVSPLMLKSIIPASSAFAAQAQKEGSKMNDAALESLREMLCYTDAQWEKWKSNPQNYKRAKGGLEFPKYRLVAEVISAYGCGAGHKVGDKIVFSGGELLSKENPERICFGLLSAISPYVQLVMERVFNGEDPTIIAFPQTHCPDVGVDHGGWGEVIVEIKVAKVQA